MYRGDSGGIDERAVVVEAARTEAAHVRHTHCDEPRLPEAETDIVVSMDRLSLVSEYGRL